MLFDFGNYTALVRQGRRKKDFEGRKLVEINARAITSVKVRGKGNKIWRIEAIAEKTRVN